MLLVGYNPNKHAKVAKKIGKRAEFHTTHSPEKSTCHTKR